MKILLSFFFALLASTAFSQSTLPLRADTILIEKTGGNGELKIKNSTRDSLGLLVNIGGGRTRFMRVKQITDTSFVIPNGAGGDTITIIPGSSGGAGTVIQVNTGYGLSGGPITSTGTLLVDSASLATYFLRRKDSTLYSTVSRLVDSAAALRAAISGAAGSPGGSNGQVQYNNAGAFAGAFSWDNVLQKATMDSLAAIKVRATQHSFNPISSMIQFNADSFVVSGHSIMACNDGCPNLGFAFVIANFLGYPIRNYGVPSTGDITAVSKQLLNVNPGHNALTGIMPSLNNWREMDVDNVTTGYKTRNAHYNTLKSVFWNAQASNNINPTNGAGITRNGSWSINWDGSTAGGKNTSLGAYTSTIGNYIEWAFTGTNAGVRVFGGDNSGTIYINPDLKVEIDGVPVDTIYTNNQTDGNDVGSVSLNSQLIPVTEVYFGLSAGAHTMRVTSLNAGYFLVDGFFNVLDSANAKYQIWFHEPYMRQSGYNTSALTYLKTTEMNARTDSLRGSIHASYRNRIIIGHTNSLYDTLNSNDGLHPDTVGHAQIGNGVINDFITPVDDPTIVYDSVCDCYVGYKNGQPYELAYSVDVANNLTAAKDSVGYNMTRSAAATTNTIPVWTDGGKKILGNSNITMSGTTTTFGGTNSVFTSTVKIQGGALSGLDISSRGDNTSVWAIYSPGVTRDLRFFNALGTPTDRFTFTQLGTFKIGTTVNQASIDKRGLYSHRSVAFNQDSVDRLSTLGAFDIIVIDTSSTDDSNKIKRIPYSLLPGFANPMTTAGDIIVGGASGVPTRKAIGSSNQLFGVDNAGTGHEYKTIAEGTGIGITHSTNTITVAVDPAVINTAVKDSTGYYTVTGTTTDATPATLASIIIPDGYVIMIEATCIAQTNDGNHGYTAIKSRGYAKDASSVLIHGTINNISADQYLSNGGGLTTASFTITAPSAAASIIQVTGEAATTIHWKVRYKLLTLNVSF